MLSRWDFHGGVRLDRHKELSSEQSLSVAPIPKQLTYPLQQRGGLNATPLVTVGDAVLKGQVIAHDEHPLSVPIHAASSGVVRALENRVVPHPSGLDGLCIVIDTDGEDRAVRTNTMKDFHRSKPDTLRQRIRDAGVVGMGGAGFSTAAKVNPGDRAIDLLVLNGAECEPYITCDDCLLRTAPERVLGGAAILMRILGVERCIIAVEADMPEAAAVLEAIRVRDGITDVAILKVPSKYPTGGEKQLIQVLTGREVPVRGIPADVGVVCQNVGTAAAVYTAVVEGWPLIERIVTVTGPGIARPQNVLARIGTPIADLVAHCGGYTDRAQRLIMGGPMMGLALPSDELPITKSSNCILVADDQTVGGEKQTLPCIRCGACAEVCPVNLIPQQLYWHSRSDQLKKVQAYNLFDCIECGCCDYVCPSRIPLVQYFRAAKGRILAKQVEQKKADHARVRFEERQARKELEKREKEEATRRKKEALEQAQAAAKAAAATIDKEQA